MCNDQIHSHVINGDINCNKLTLTLRPPLLRGIISCCCPFVHELVTKLSANVVHFISSLFLIDIVSYLNVISQVIC